MVLEIPTVIIELLFWSMYIRLPAAICRMCVPHSAMRAFSRAFPREGSRIATRSAMMATTTNSSINVKPLATLARTPTLESDLIMLDLLENIFAPRNTGEILCTTGINSTWYGAEDADMANL